MGNAPEIDANRTRSQKLRRRLVGVFVGVVILAGLAAGALTLAPKLTAEEVASYPSPRGDCRIVVYRTPGLLAMPGQASDAPGRIDLVDNAGKVLKSLEIEMVQLASTPIWTEASVSMKLLFDWKMKPAAGKD